MSITLNDINRAYGISWAPVRNESCMTTNLNKLQFLLPFWGLFLYYGAKASGPQLPKPMLVRAIISSTVVGIPVNIAVDVVASVTTQVANAVLYKSE